MTRDEKIAEARRLRAEGLTLQAIGERLGVSHATVWKWLNPERHREHVLKQEARPERKAAKRAWENEHDRGECPCGATLGVGARRHGIKVCRDCFDEMRAVGTAMRRERIAEMWARGLKQREIAAEIGTTRPTISVEMSRMRAAGWDLPLRRNWTPDGYERARNARRAA